MQDSRRSDTAVKPSKIVYSLQPHLYVYIYYDRLRDMHGLVGCIRKLPGSLDELERVGTGPFMKSLSKRSVASGQVFSLMTGRLLLDKE